MKQRDLLNAIEDTTVNLLTLIRLYIHQKGQQSSVRLSDSANQLINQVTEQESSVQDVYRTFSHEEELCYHTIITNIIYLISMNQSDVDEYCTQCLNTLLNILTQESNIVRTECPSNIIELYNKIKNNVRLESTLLINQLSKVLLLKYNNVN